MKYFILRLTLIVSQLIVVIPSLQADDANVLKAVDRAIRLRQYSVAVDYLRPLLAQHNALAQYRMGGLYRSGKGVKKDAAKALQFYRLAANNGLADAQYALASLLEKQGSAEQKKNEVAKWYQAAAAQGYRKAKRKLALLTQPGTQSDLVDQAAVFSAVRINDMDLIKRLIEQSVDLNFKDNKQRTPLMVALLSGHPKMAALLLPHTRQPDQPDIDQSRPIHIAVSKGYRALVEQLIKRGVNVNAPDRLGNTPLILATRHDDGAMIELLLNQHADPARQNRKIQNAPQIAQTLKLKNARRLFEQYQITLPAQNPDYADVNIDAFKKTVAQSNSIYRGWPLLNIASLLGETAIVKQLLNQGSDINARDPAGNSALHRAASKGQLATAKMLIERGIKINALNHRQESALFTAARQGQLKIVRYLISHGADSQLINQNGKSTLAVAIASRHPASAEFLSTRKLDPLSIHRALLLAIEQKMENVAIKLLKRDDRLLSSDQKGRTALWKSVDKGLSKTTKALLESGRIEIDQADKKGETALARAAYRGHAGIFDLVLKYNANVQALTQQGNSILMLAIVSGNNALIERVISLDVDFNQQNKAGDTALMLAAARGNLQTVKWLIEIPVDMQLRNRHDRNAYQIAQAAGHADIAEYIRQKSGRLFKLFN